MLSIHALNPIGLVVELAHEIVVFNNIPSLWDWAHAAVFCFGIFFAGYYLFHRLESKIVEVL